MDNSIFTRVKELCDEKGISQRQLQRDLNLSVSTVSRWKTSIPSATTLQTVADYFGVTTDYLTGRTKYRNREHMLQCFDAEHKLNIDDIDVPYDLCVQTEEGVVLKVDAPKYIDAETRELAEKIMNSDQLQHMLQHIVNLSQDKINALYELLKVMDDKK